MAVVELCGLPRGGQQHGGGQRWRHEARPDWPVRLALCPDGCAKNALQQPLVPRVTLDLRHCGVAPDSWRPTGDEHLRHGHSVVDYDVACI